MIVKQLIQAFEKNNDSYLQIMLPNGEYIPQHFHVTEVGLVEKIFLDCGGTRRLLNSCVLQVWLANDFHHRLLSGRLGRILRQAEMEIGYVEIGDLPVEIEYGTDVVSHYVVEDIKPIKDGVLTVLLITLKNKKTECLSPDKCGVTTKCNDGGCGCS